MRAGRHDGDDPTGTVARGRGRRLPWRAGVTGQPRSVSRPLPGRGRGWRRFRRLVEAKDRLLDLGVPAVGERDLRADDRESCPLQHPERPHIVTRGAGEQRPDQNRFQEQGERSAGNALSPERFVDPIRDLGIAVNDEAADTADQPPIDARLAYWVRSTNQPTAM